MQNVALINTSRTVWLIIILLPSLPCSSFSDDLLQDAYIISQKSVDNFEIAHEILFNLNAGRSSSLKKKKKKNV